MKIPGFRMCLMLGAFGILSATSSTENAKQAADRPITQQNRRAVMPIGTNLDALSYWSPALPLLDLMKTAGKWTAHSDAIFDTGDDVPVDAKGWPSSQRDSPTPVRYSSVLVNLLHDNPAAQPYVRYAVLFDGAGPIEAALGTRVVSRQPGLLIVEASQVGSLYLSFAPQSGEVRNVRVIRQDLLPFYEAGHIFNPLYLARIKPFHVLRFMDWMHSNTLYDKNGDEVRDLKGISDRARIDWSDRPMPDSRTWGDDSHGIPVEIMVDLANQNNADPWFNMPINASNDYIRGFATYVHTHLNPNLRVHVELSNEVWNWTFPQAHYAQAKALAAFGPDANWLEWYGMRAAQMAVVWKSVFGEPSIAAGRPGRVHIVFGTQFAWKGLEENGLDTPHWHDIEGHARHASAYFDEYAITGYYGGVMSNDDDYDHVRAWWHDPDGGFGSAIAALRHRISDFNAPLYRYHADVARRYRLSLITYEGGFGEVTPPSHQNDQAYTDFLAKLQRRPEIKGLEEENYRAFQSAGGSLFMNYGIIGTPGKWGNWSALESVRQTSSPRYDAMRQWAAANPL